MFHLFCSNKHKTEKQFKSNVSPELVFLFASQGFRIIYMEQGLSSDFIHDYFGQTNSR